MAWERTRWLATVLLSPHSKKTLKPTDIAQFPWEESTQIDISKKDELMAHFSKLSAAMDADHNKTAIPVSDQGI